MLKDPENYSYDYTRKLISTISDAEVQRWACLLYGTGARVSEALSIRAKDITEQENTSFKYMIVRCPVFKKHDGKTQYRQAPIRMDEQWLIQPIKVLLARADNPESPLIKIHRATIYRKLMKEIAINPHGFRKLRATHLATKFGFNETKLVKFFGWADFRPAGIYAKANLEDIMY
jgi:integrase